MAEKKKKKSIYSRKLKDVNKDGKRNFGDTWLGDLIGADGKTGVQKDKLKASLKGSRRESDMKDKAKTAAAAKKTSAKKMSKVDTTDDKRAARKMASSDKPSIRSKVDTTDDKRSARTNASSGTAPKYKGVTWEEYLSIDANEALKKLAYGLPSGMTKREFTTKAREEGNAKRKSARLDRTDNVRAERKMVESTPGKEAPAGLRMSGMSKGGMTKKSGYKKGGMVKANCGASMKPNRKARK